MASIKFYYRSKAKKGTITLRLSHKTEVDLFANTQKHIYRENWQFNNSKSKTGIGQPNTRKGGEIRNLKVELAKLEDFVLKRFEEKYNDDNVIDKEWLVYIIDSFFNRVSEIKHSSQLLYNLEHLIQNAFQRKNGKGGTGLSEGRIKHYNRLKGLLKEYLGKRPILVKDIDAQFHTDFINWMVKEKKYSLSYASKTFSNIKTVCKHAQRFGVEVNPILNSLHITRKTERFIIYLTPEELEIIEEKEMPSNYLKNAKKWLLFGCSIGQRGGDLLNITEENFKLHNELEVIQLKQQKGHKNVTIPIFDDTRRYIKDGLPHKISLTKLNEYIKTVCKICGLNAPTKGQKNNPLTNRKDIGIYPKHELITSHICRRSFASNKYGLLRTPLIMAVTGHSSEQQLLKYIGKEGADFASEIADFYALQKLKKEKQPQLKVVKGTKSA